MGKYEPLTRHLHATGPEEWSASFGEIEDVLGFSLPQSARKYREWWGNQSGAGHSQAKAWQDAGWQVWKVDLAGERVVLRRTSRSASPAGGTEAESEERLIEQAAQLLGIEDRHRIIREALRSLIQREAARRLARLGGTMPDFKAPARRRFG